MKHTLNTHEERVNVYNIHRYQASSKSSRRLL